MYVANIFVHVQLCKFMFANLTNCLRLVLSFSLNMVVLHMWRCIVVWQIGFCNLIYCTACSTELVFQTDYFSKGCFVKFVWQTQIALLCLQVLCLRWFAIDFCKFGLLV